MDSLTTTGTLQRGKVSVRNGQTGTVLGFVILAKPRPQQAIKVLLDNGRIVKVPINFKHMRLGYSSTVQSAQGNTYEEVFVLLAGGVQNLPLSYVQGSRSRWATHLYTERMLYDQINDIEQSLLVSQMGREVDLSLAADLFVPPTEVGGTTAELIEKVVKQWKQQDAASTLIVTKDESVAAKINRECSKIQYAMAQVDWERQRHSDPIKAEQTKMPTIHSGESTAAVGDRIRLYRRNISHGIVENELGTVTDITPDKFSVQLDRGPAKEFNINAAPEFEHGYAVSYEQANERSYRMKTGLLVEPEKFHEPATHTWNQPDYLQSNPITSCTQTIYSPPMFTQPDYCQSFQFEKVKTYMDHSMYSQMAVDWQQKTIQMNQSTSWAMASDYSHTSQTQYSLNF